MAKKSNSLNPTAGLAFGSPVEVKKVDAQELQEVQHVRKNNDTLNSTQGRKGHKLPRINMAFTPDNHEYIKHASRQLGISVTEFINNLIDEDRKK